MHCGEPAADHDRDPGPQARDLLFECAKSHQESRHETAPGSTSTERLLPYGDHELTPGMVPGDQEHPDWSHDGRRVAFAVVRADGVRDLWVAREDGSDARMVYECRLQCTEADDPAWSPDDTRLAFHQFNAVGDEGLGTGSIEILDLAAGTVETAFTGAETEYLYDPRWDSTGTQIVFENDRCDSARLDASVILDSTVGIIDLTDKVRTFEPVLPRGSFAHYPDWHWPSSSSGSSSSRRGPGRRADHVCRRGRGPDDAQCGHYPGGWHRSGTEVMGRHTPHAPAPPVNAVRHPPE